MTDHIAERVSAAREHLRQHPDAGRVEDTTVVVGRIDGLRVRAVDANGFSVEADMPVGIGGSLAAMTPGTLLRAALGTCDATTLALEAAARGIELSRLEVEVSSVSDDRGLLGFEGVQAGPEITRVRYRLASADASEQELISLVEYTERHSPVLSSLRDATRVDVAIEIS